MTWIPGFWHKKSPTVRVKTIAGNFILQINHHLWRWTNTIKSKKRLEVTQIDMPRPSFILLHPVKSSMIHPLGPHTYSELERPNHIQRRHSDKNSPPRGRWCARHVSSFYWQKHNADLTEAPLRWALPPPKPQTQRRKSHTCQLYRGGVTDFLGAVFLPSWGFDRKKKARRTTIMAYTLMDPQTWSGAR